MTSQPDNLRKLARYYTDVLTALSENSGRALRDLRLGRSYGLVADLSAYKIGGDELLTDPAVSLGKVFPPLASEESDLTTEPDPSESFSESTDTAEMNAPDVIEGHALIRIWRKQKQDPYNRECLLGYGLLRGSNGSNRRTFGPLICFRVRPEYDPETRAFRIEKVSVTPFPNLTLLAQALNEDELSDLRPHLHQILSTEEFNAAQFERLARAISGATTSLRGLTYLPGPMHGLAEVLRLAGESLPALAVGAVLMNIPRGNAYLLDDLEKLATSGADSDLELCAVGPILEVPTDDSSNEAAKKTIEEAPDPLFPLESNKEQRKVAQFATEARILVVHGPPGTGKSQTICNLVSHLVASGKTVLVTSQKDKALEVVRDKLPKIAYLALSLLRSDEDSQKSLLQALEYSRAAAAQEDIQELSRDKQFIESKLKDIREHLSKLETKFSTLRRVENQHASTFERLARLRHQRAKNAGQGILRRLSLAFQTYRTSAVTSSINRRHTDDTRTITTQLHSLANQKRNLVLKLLDVLRRLQLHRAAHNRATSFTVEQTKKLLARKRKTASLEKLKERINFKDLLSVFPCWILSIDDVARLFPLQCGLFDYLIVDEASQCNQATALHLAYRAKRMVVVGDEKQLPNASVQWLRTQTVEQLMQRNGLLEHAKKEFLTAHESLLGLSLGSKDRQVHLVEHFRCDPRIISWSNREFYGNSLRILTPLRSMRFSTPIEIRNVPGASEDVDRHVNELEAIAVVNEVVKLLDDRTLHGLSIGVISPFQHQADLIYVRLQEKLLYRWNECESRGLTSSTADGFQGDERDIILYSLRHGPNSRPGSITGIEANQGWRRINVAFTRARRKVILFTSMPIGTFPGRYIRSFLDHAQDVLTSQVGPLLSIRQNDEFDSDFERDVCLSLRSRNLEVATQFPVAGYRIDLVARDKAGRRLGIECDGQFHYDELGQLREEDYEREEILERAGWPIHRIPARRFYSDKESEVNLAIKVLSAQPTDEEISYLETEALDPRKIDEDIDMDSIPLSMSTAEKSTTATVRPTTPPKPSHGEVPSIASEPFDKWGDPPPFSAPEAWIDASRWARVVGHWTLANRVFLWEFGNKLRDGRYPDDQDKARAAALWADARRQGFKGMPKLPPPARP